MPLELAQEILGHASVTTTRIYVRSRKTHCCRGGSVSLYYGSARYRCSLIDEPAKKMRYVGSVRTGLMKQDRTPSHLPHTCPEPNLYN